MHYLLFIACGTFVGLLSGMLGTGTGLLMVPILLMHLAEQVPEQYLMHTATATSISMMCLSTLVAVLKHHKTIKINWQVAIPLGIGCVLGAIIGRNVSILTASDFLIIIFVLFTIWQAFSMLLKKRAKAPTATIPVPNVKWIICIGILVGNIASILGLGGGVLFVPLLLRFSFTMQHAIAISTVCSCCMAWLVTTGTIISNHTLTSSPDLLGYIYLPAFIGVSLTSVITAPLGVKLAYQLNTDTLKSLFALLLLCISFRMLVTTVF